MKIIYKPETVYFSRMGGYDVIVIIMMDDGRVLFEPSWQMVEQDEILTLDGIIRQVEERFHLHGTIIVMAEGYLSGTVYRYGNRGDFWEKIGETKGFA